METEIYTRTALVYAYKTRDAGKWGIDPSTINLAYQVAEPLTPHQCDFGKDFIAHMLREFKDAGGTIKVINKTDELILPLSEHKVLVPVPKKLLQEWELTDFLD
ncbi:MAG: hypothetical protein KJ583_04405 [Nanoarchaeota archaeon]|nr:hypothetical protein [Nanoarchaeota archaeon]MBU1270299.1 hypothetical protein [Nanoarchaeota archaeon]MBU1604533.1 hypothetical protein [Nanoarchaeota archaeon]MBU2442868.1 hypothetical protein [Nanoarchaeota archaeon]